MSDESKSGGHTAITVVGVLIFVGIIGTFWWLGLPNLFDGKQTVPPVVHSLQDQWEQINNTAAQTQDLIDSQQQRPAASPEEISAKLKELLSTTAKASGSSTTP